MPVEIKELVIKAEFGTQREDGDAGKSGMSSAVPQDELVQECVRQVLEIIERKRER